MFFIVGSARSGTTMLRLMLNAHPAVSVPPESRFIVELYRGDEVDVEPFLAALARHPRFAAWDLPIEAVARELDGSRRAPYRDAIEAAYRAYARAHGKTRWGDKTPRYVEHIALLARLFPEARFVHVVRDGRNVALSYADVPFGPKTVAKAALLWRARVVAGTAAGRALEAGRYLELRYEDLVEDPRGEVETLCRFLGMPFDEAMLDYTERARDALLPRAERFNPHLTERPRTGTRSWEQQMTPRHVEMFEALAGDALAALGYPRRFPEPGLTARLGARAGALGLPVARLRSGRKREVTDS